MWLHPRLQKFTHLLATGELMKGLLQIHFLPQSKCIKNVMNNFLLSYVRCDFKIKECITFIPRSH
jgi:hypothetical protein